MFLKNLQAFLHKDFTRNISTHSEKGFKNFSLLVEIKLAMRHKFLVIQLKVQEVHKGHITNPGICKPLSKIRNEGQALLIEKPCYA